MNTYGFWIGLVLSAGAMVMMGVLAWEGSKFSVANLTFFGLVWIAFAHANSRSWRRTIRDWGNTLDGWSETNLLVRDLSNLLEEASNDLSTWDREKAEDLVTRANTVMRLRGQNLAAKMEEDK